MLALSATQPTAARPATEEVVLGAPQSATPLLLDGAARGGRAVAVGERGHIFFSADDGRTWRRARAPARALLTAVHLHDERTGWAVGHDATVLRTDDGGESWRIQHHAPEEERPLLDVWFRDERSGFAVGAYGLFLATRDGGERWVPRLIDEDDFHLNALAPAGPDRLFVAGEAGAIYRSDDGGETWRRLPSPYAGSWFDILAFDRDRVLLVGLRGRLFRSGDGGESWARTETGTAATLTGAALLAPDRLLIAGLEGQLLASADGGRSLSSARLPSRQGIAGAFPLAGGDALLVGEFGLRRLPRAELDRFE